MQAPPTDPLYDASHPDESTKEKRKTFRYPREKSLFLMVLDEVFVLGVYPKNKTVCKLIKDDYHYHISFFTGSLKESK